MTTAEACCQREGGIMMSMEKMSTDVIIGPDDSTMRKLRVKINNICTSAYIQGLAERTSKEIKLTYEQLRPAIRGWIAARMSKDIPEELTDRMTNTLSDTFMGHMHTVQTQTSYQISTVSSTQVRE